MGSNMRLLKLLFNGVPLFKNESLELDFYAADRVPRQEDGLPVADVTRAGEGSSIYSQNVIGISGVNASGKTTVLNLLRFALDILAVELTSRELEGQRPMLGKVGDRLKMFAVFWLDGSFYLLDSSLVRPEGSAYKGRMRNYGYVFEDEAVWRLVAPRVNRRTIAHPQAFMDNATVVFRRSQAGSDGTALTQRELEILGDDRSIVSLLTGRVRSKVSSPTRRLPTTTLASPVVQAFDPSIESLLWNEEDGVYTLTFKGERPRVVDASVAVALLSRGTVYGAELVNRAVEVLSGEGYLLVDEIEEAINRSLVATVIGLFASPVTNPRGAQLVFTTHYPELLDALHRKDNVYLLVRGEDGRAEAVKYSERVSRIENKKSEVVLSDMIRGTMPRYPDVQALRDYVRVRVNG